MSSGSRFQRGDTVVYTKVKRSSCPGPRAREVRPDPRGEGYTYKVDKFWVVASVEGDQVVLRTRSGKQHVVLADDGQLRRPSWWERLWYHGWFPSLAEAEQSPADEAPAPRERTGIGAF